MCYIWNMIWSIVSGNFFQESLVKRNYQDNLFLLLFEMLKDTKDKIRLCTLRKLDKSENPYLQMYILNSSRRNNQRELWKSYFTCFQSTFPLLFGSIRTSFLYGIQTKKTRLFLSFQTYKSRIRALGFKNLQVSKLQSFQPPKGNSFLSSSVMFHDLFIWLNVPLKWNTF